MDSRTYADGLPEPIRRTFGVSLFAAIFVFIGFFGFNALTALVISPVQIQKVLTHLDEASEKVDQLSLKPEDRERLSLLFSQTAYQIRKWSGLDETSSPHHRTFLMLSLAAAFLAFIAGHGLKHRQEWARKLAMTQVVVSFPLVLRSLVLNYSESLKTNQLQQTLFRLGFFDKLDSIPSSEELATLQMGLQLFVAMIWVILVLWFFTRPLTKLEFNPGDLK